MGDGLLFSASCTARVGVYPPPEKVSSHRERSVQGSPEVMLDFVGGVNVPNILVTILACPEVLLCSGSAI
ncbi:unnamed protein product [Thlaspi arvense]|uniref:Uncharacterized protein n=1 Tax=Thlaspi arvense TaxID=13288 RepID=A0AAU9ST56_THLAR|nr:unnamed protein product [Thlaspi arvense]